MSLHGGNHRNSRKSICQCADYTLSKLPAHNKLSTNDYCCLCDGDGGVICFYTVFLEIKKTKPKNAQGRKVPEAIQIIHIVLFFIGTLPDR